MNTNDIPDRHYVDLFYHNIHLKLHDKMNIEQDEAIKTKIFWQIEKYNYEYIGKSVKVSPFDWWTYIVSDLFHYVDKEIINYLKNNDITIMSYAEFKESYREHLNIEILLKNC